MGIKFKFFEAGHGDSILVSTDEGTHILIDGGEEGTYAEIEEYMYENEIDKLDLVVLTHIDGDHINGIIEMMEEKDNWNKIKEIWFNDSTIKIAIKNGEIGYGDGNALEDLIAESSIIHKKNISFHKNCEKNEREYNIGSDIKLTLLSPKFEDLGTQVNEWKTYNGEIAGKSCIDRRNIEEIVELFKNENMNKAKTKKLAKATSMSLANKTSIAFILEYDGKEFLFLGDADIKVINKSLIDLGYFEKPLKIEFVKLAHHGSKKNINEAFLNLIDTEKFIILTDCSSFAHPDKETLGLIVTHDKERTKKIDLIFNYYELISKKLSKSELVEYNFRAYACEDNILEVL